MQDWNLRDWILWHKRAQKCMAGKCRKNKLRVWLMKSGPKLQMENSRLPNWVHVFTTTAALVVKERSSRRPDSSLLNLAMLLK